MLHNTLSNLKNIFKKGVEFGKSLTIDTIVSIKNDICQSINERKEFKEWKASKNPTENPENKA